MERKLLMGGVASRSNPIDVDAIVTSIAHGHVNAMHASSGAVGNGNSAQGNIRPILPMLGAMGVPVTR
jgi:hypothetical protein